MRVDSSIFGNPPRDARCTCAHLFATSRTGLHPHRIHTCWRSSTEGNQMTIQIGLILGAWQIAPQGQFSRVTRRNHDKPPPFKPLGGVCGGRIYHSNRNRRTQEHRGTQLSWRTRISWDNAHLPGYCSSM